MAGEIFTTQNKTRPGFYYKFNAAAARRNLGSELGIVALPLELSWGKIGEIFEITPQTANDEVVHLIGESSDQIPAIREALKRAQKLLVYRVGGGEKGTLSMGNLTATARYAGTKGNSISLNITADQETEGKFVVTTYYKEMTQDTQRGLSNCAEVRDNEFVTFSGTGALQAAAGGNLTGGTDTAAQLSDYEGFLEAIEPLIFNSFCYCGEDEDVKEAFAAAARRFVSQGKLAQCFLTEYAAEHEAVSSLKNGVILSDGTEIDRSIAVAWAAAAAASAGPAKSLTYEAYDGAEKPNLRLTNAQIQQALKGGQLVFVGSKNAYGQDIAAIEQDINTLTKYTENRPQPWSKNRVVRAMYYLVNSLMQVWHTSYIGKIDNNKAGRDLFKSDLASLMRTLEGEGAFENFDAQEDIVVEKGATSEAVTATLGVQPVDAMEKMYFTVEVR